VQQLFRSRTDDLVVQIDAALVSRHVRRQSSQDMVREDAPASVFVVVDFCKRVSADDGIAPVTHVEDAGAHERV
jgi:hypothetical protein